MRRLALAIVLVTLASAGARASGAAFELTQEGRLLDADDHPVESPGLTMSFRFFEASSAGDNETALWSSGDCSVPVHGGAYAVLLGAGAGVSDGCGSGLTTDVVPLGSVRYLEVTVGGVTMSPRLRLGAVPWAADASTLAGESLADLDQRYVRATGAGAQAFAGPVSATAFSGDGSGLTNLPASELTGTVPDSALGDAVLSVDAAVPLAATRAGGAVTVELAEAGASQDGYLAAADFARFSGKLDGVGHDASLAGDGTASAPLAVSSVAWSKITGAPSTLASVSTTGAGLTGDGTTANPLAIDPALTSLAGRFSTNETGVGLGVDAPEAKLDVAGGVRVGNDTGDCTSARAGTIRFTGTAFEGCDGHAWSPLVAPQADVCGTFRVAGANKCVYDYSGQVETFSVPAGVTKVTVKVWGAGGGGGNGAPGAPGGFATATVDTTGVTRLAVVVGQGGWAGVAGTSHDAQPTFGGGGGLGGGASHSASLRSGLGGGMSGVFATSEAFSNALVVAGGGGGGGSYYSAFGYDVGFGGGATGQAGGLQANDGGYDDTSMYASREGGGGTQTTGGAAGADYGGATAGSALSGGTGGSYNGAGGGGGYYGGGGSTAYANGGGGSGYLQPSRTTNGAFSVAAIDRSSTTTAMAPPATNDGDYATEVASGGSRWTSAGGGGTAGSGRVVISW